MKYVVAVLVVIFVFLATVVEVRLRVPPVQAAAPTAAPAVPCPEWRKAGQWTLHLCEGDDWTQPTCVHSTSGMMSCRWPE